MSKKQYSPNNSDPSDSEVYEVEKIVNQRIISIRYFILDGKK